jgi:arylsulfatase A-like enzyme
VTEPVGTSGSPHPSCPDPTPQSDDRLPHTHQPSKAVSFIEGTPAGQPLLLWFAPYAPHEPATPAPRHTSAYQDLALHRPPNFDEADVSDKPSHIKSLPRLTQSSKNRIDSIRGLQLRSLLAVDDAIADIVEALESTGRLENTMIVFSSDNGFSWGEHRWGATGANNKQLAYDEDARVPFVVRYDAAVTNPSTRNELVLTIDVAPTFAALAGTTAPGADGVSLMPLLTPGSPPWRTDFLIEHLITQIPTYCAVRTQGHLYVQHATGEEELYVTADDPYQLNNRASDPTLVSLRNTFRSRTVALCTPGPPGFTPFG